MWVYTVPYFLAGFITLNRDFMMLDDVKNVCFEEAEVFG